MASSPANMQVDSSRPDNWGPPDDQPTGPPGPKEPNGTSVEHQQSREHAREHNHDRTHHRSREGNGVDGQGDYVRGSSVDEGASVSGSKKGEGASAREKQVKPNKVYIGNLPEHTRQEDLENCFGKIGKIVNIELKVGYGFVEFESRVAAEESVAKYHEGYFMGNKIRVELSHGGGRTAKYTGDPGACFKCGQMGHWARECPNQSVSNGGPPRRSDPDSLVDRMHPPRDYPPRDHPAYRDDFPSRYPPRDSRYGYDLPPGPPGRDFRRPVTPPRDYRDYRDYPGAPPPRVRDYDDYRMRGPPPAIPPSRYEGRSGYYPPGDVDPARDTAGYPGRYPPQAPPRDPYERYDRRGPPSSDRYAAYPPSSRPRSPRAREEYERGAPPREYSSEFRGRPLTPPPRFADFPPQRQNSIDVTPGRYRRRSASPPPRSGGGGAPYESVSYPSGTSRDGFSGNGYPVGPPGAQPPRTRDYPPQRGREVEPPVSYRRA